MAYGDKKTTILDVIGNLPTGIDRMEEKEIIRKKLARDAGYSRQAIRRNVSHFDKEAEKLLPAEMQKWVQPTIDKAMNEKDPTAGGTYKNNVYYSNVKPKGHGDIPWSKKASIIVSKASQHNAKKSDILKAQKYFVDIGYLHPSDIDGYKGPQFQGVIRRWNQNTSKSSGAIMDAMKTWKDNLFDGGAEEYEEDLREGGGDQGY